MGLRMTKFNFVPGKNEQIETVITLPEEKRSIIHGYVKDHNNKLVKDAIVKLFEVLECNKHHSLKPITHTFTDECGQFILGPLIPCKPYVIMVWIDDVKIRELVIHPDDCLDFSEKNIKDKEIVCNVEDCIDEESCFCENDEL